MNALESMVTKLLPTDIYNLEPGTNVHNELSAYAAALDAHRENLDAVLRECFLSTAETYGIELREKVFGSPRTDYSITDRRNMLMLRNSIGESDFTLDGFDKIMQSLGVTDYTVTEMPTLQTVSVSIGGSYNSRDKAWIINEVTKFVPAHIRCNVYFGGKTWSELDALVGTYAEFDSNNYTWAQLNNL